MGFPCDLMEVGFRVEGLGLRGLGFRNEVRGFKRFPHLSA